MGGATHERELEEIMTQQNKVLVFASSIAVIAAALFLLMQDSKRPGVTLSAMPEIMQQDEPAVEPARTWQAHASVREVRVGRVDTVAAPAPAPAKEIVVAVTGPRNINLHIVDPAGHGLAGIQCLVRWETSCEDARATEAPRLFESGRDGRHSLPTPGGAWTGRIEIDSERWHLPQAVRFPASGDSGQEILIPLVERVSFALNITFSDGEPYSGPMSWSSGNFMISAECKDGTASLAGMPIADSRVVISPKRPGFEQLCETLEAAAIRHGSVHQLTIPKSRHAMGTLRINVPRPAEATLPIMQVDMVVQSVDLNRVVCRGMEGFAGAGGVQECAQLRPGEYLVTASAEGMAARHVANVEDCRVTELDLRWEKGAAFTAELVRSDGTPLRNAVLRVGTSDYPAYPAQPRPGVLAVSGSDGMVSLAGLAPGQWQLVAEAIGTDPQSIDVTAQAGNATHLGRIVLSEARTRVVVRLTNARAQEEYTFRCMHPTIFGTSLSKKGNSEGTAEFENLPARPYCFLICRNDGSVIGSQRVDLAGVGTGNVQVDIEGHFKNGPVTVVSK